MNHHYVNIIKFLQAHFSKRAATVEDEQAVTLLFTPGTPLHTQFNPVVETKKKRVRKPRPKKAKRVTNVHPMNDEKFAEREGDIIEG